MRRRVSTALLAACALTMALISPAKALDGQAQPAVTDGTFDSLISLTYTSGSEAVCTGVMITPTWALSARHCFFEANGNNKPVLPKVVGFGVEGTGNAGITTIYGHGDVDLVLLQLTHPSPYRPAVIELNPHLADGAAAHIGGFGQGTRPTSRPANFTAGHLHIDDRLGPLIQVEDRDVEVVEGDSGGPVFQNGALIGITSQMHDNNNSGYEGAYGSFTVVADHVNWLENRTGQPLTTVTRSDLPALPTRGADVGTPTPPPTEPEPAPQPTREPQPATPPARSGSSLMMSSVAFF